MCGLFGYRLHDNIVQAPPMWPVFCSVAAVEMERRGTDGWGLAGLRPFAHDVEVLRCETRLTESLDSHIFGAFHSMILHTRAKTTGEHIVTNNHPFTHGRIIGAHNGVVYNHKELSTRYHRDFPVDSQHIFAHIDEQKSMSDLEMYGAIEYYNQDDPTRTYLMRCYHGQLQIASLYYGPSEEPFAIVWASTLSALRDGARLAGFRLYQYKEPENQTLYYADGDAQLYTTDQKLLVSPKTHYVPARSCDWDAHGYRSHDSYKGFGSTYTTPTQSRKSDTAQISLWINFRDMKPLTEPELVSPGFPGYAICRDCGVYYSLLSVKGCLICGHKLDVLSQSWASKRYLPAEPFLYTMLDQGRYTPPLPKKFVKKHLKLLEELFLSCKVDVADSLTEVMDALSESLAANAPATGEAANDTEQDTPPDLHGYLC